MDTMFFGAVAMTRAALPGMREQGGGTIVQMSSMGGQVTMPGFGAYCAAKFALEAISESLAAEAAPFGIRVLIVEPGAAPSFAVSSGSPRPLTRNTPLLDGGDLERPVRQHQLVAVHRPRSPRRTPRACRRARAPTPP